jgi:hypothetical protein
MTCQLLQLQSFAPAKIVCERPELIRYTIDELTEAVLYAVRKVIYPEMTEYNKHLFDAPNAIFSKNRNRSIVAARYFIMFFLNVDFKWEDYRCANHFNLHRTASLWARQAIYGQLSSKVDNQYKEIYSLVKRHLSVKKPR